MNRSLPAPLLLLASLGLASCNFTSPWRDLGEVSTQASLGGATSIEVLTGVGDVEVLPSVDGQVRVQAQVRVRDDHDRLRRELRQLLLDTQQASLF